jgi:hypothetical protein
MQFLFLASSELKIINLNGEPFQTPPEGKLRGQNLKWLLNKF